MIAKATASLMAIFMAFTPPTGYQYDAWIDLPSDLQELVYEECMDAPEVITPEVVYAIIFHESNFIEDATNVNDDGTTDTGYGQINECNWEWLAEIGIDVHTPDGNIRAIIYILSAFAEKGYTLEEVLAAYARGESGMLNGNGFWFPEEIFEIIRAKSYRTLNPFKELIQTMLIRINGGLNNAT